MNKQTQLKDLKLKLATACGVSIMEATNLKVYADCNPSDIKLIEQEFLTPAEMFKYDWKIDYNMGGKSYCFKNLNFSDLIRLLSLPLEHDVTFEFDNEIYILTD